MAKLFLVFAYTAFCKTLSEILDFQKQYEWKKYMTDEIYIYN
jgi:hypothetical protein